MKSGVRLLSLVLLFGGPWLLAAAAQDATEVRVKKIAQQRYGENFREFARSGDRFLAKQFKGYAVYQVDVFNPQSRLAGRTILEHTLVAPPKGDPICLENLQEVAAFLDDQPPARKLTIQQTVQAFAALGRVRILNRPNDLDGETVQAEKVITPPAFDTVGDEQHARFYVLADPHITSVLRIDLYRSAAGKLRYAAEMTSSRGGYD